MKKLVDVKTDDGQLTDFDLHHQHETLLLDVINDVGQGPSPFQAQIVSQHLDQVYPARSGIQRFGV